MNRLLNVDSATAANRRHWDELGTRHPHTPHYGEKVDRLVAGGSVLRRLEIDEMGDVSGRSMLHLQCHLGTESVSWARRGAAVTGVDFSPAALESARAIAQRCGVDIRYVESDVLRLNEVLTEQFDVVYTSWGVLGWISDLERWAHVVRDHLKQGGFVYLGEFHPTAWMFDDEASEPKLRYAYFDEEPLRVDSVGSYADPSMHVEHNTSYSWYYTLGGVITALAAAGLRIDFLHEWMRAPFQFLDMLVRDETDDEEWYRAPDGVPPMPLAFTLRAHRDDR
ncbi:MAG: class I SAM-dependent methyltransferase [Candidatus Dormibacteraeota bacterium]|nr:class I SAM-dependent methyltransferase [Candidatus Dormibacteraeota bacterium]